MKAAVLAVALLGSMLLVAYVTHVGQRRFERRREHDQRNH